MRPVPTRLIAARVRAWRIPALLVRAATVAVARRRPARASTPAPLEAGA